MFAYQNLPDHGPAEPLPGLTASPMQVTKQTAKFDLTLYLSESGQGLSATWQYNTDLFDEPRIARMTGHFRTLLEAIVAAPESALSDLPLLTDAERHELLTTRNQTATPYGGNRCVPSPVRGTCAVDPGCPRGAVWRRTAHVSRAQHAGESARAAPATTRCAGRRHAWESS